MTSPVLPDVAEDAVLDLSFVLYFVYLRTALRDRAIARLVLAMTVGAILFPDGTTLVANVFGIGRGTDAPPIHYS